MVYVLLFVFVYILEMFQVIFQNCEIASLNCTVGEDKKFSFFPVLHRVGKD